MYKVTRRSKVNPQKDVLDSIMVIYILDQYNLERIVPKTKSYIWVGNEEYISFRFLAPDNCEYEEMISLDDLSAFAHAFTTQLSREEKIDNLGL